MALRVLCRRGKAALLMGLFAALFGAAATAEVPRPARGKSAPREVVIANRATRPVFQVRVSPAEADQWGDDRLGEAIIPAGGSHRVRLGRTADCLFDVQVLYDDLSREELRAVDLCRSRNVTFDGSAAIHPADPFATAHLVGLVNHSGRPIRQVFITAASADQWGDDLVPGGGIPPGEARDLSYRGGCIADVRVVFDNRSAEERRNVDICVATPLLIRPGWTTDEAPPVLAVGGANEITLLNLTGLTVTELVLYPESATDPPEDDVLGNTVLPAGAQLVVAFQRGKECRFIARISHGGDRGIVVQRGIDLCLGPKVTLEPLGKAG